MSWNKLFMRPVNNKPFSDDVWTPKYKSMVMNMLNNSIQICRKHGMEIVATYGTLLGQIRHGDLIPWDDDLDVCINKEHIDQIWKLEKEFKKHNIKITEDKTLDGYSYIKLYSINEPKIIGGNWSWPFIDVFTYEISGDTISISDAGPTYKVKTSDFLPLRTNLLGNVPISVPNNPDNILNNLYGSNWETTCISSPYSHREERQYTRNYKIPCSSLQDVTPSIYDNVWVINLERRPDRWETVRKRLEKIGITPKRFLATDAKNPEFEKIYNDMPPIQHTRTVGECACSFSHSLLWKKLHDLNVENAIIFEDDIIFDENITKELILEYINMSKGYDIVFLGYCNNDDEVYNKDIRTGSAQCLHAYAVSKKALTYLSNIKVECFEPIDHVTEKYCEKDGLCFLTNHIPLKTKTFGRGIILQDEDLGSDLPKKILPF